MYTHIITKENSEVDFLTFGYANDLLISKFEPEKVYMVPETGRVYHPADEKYGGIGLRPMLITNPNPKIATID